jgi:hypothetical protein
MILAIVDVLVILFAVTASTQWLNVINGVGATPRKRNNVITSQLDNRFLFSTPKALVFVEPFQFLPFFIGVRTFRCKFQSATAIVCSNKLFRMTFVILKRILATRFGMTLIGISSDFAVMLYVLLTTLPCISVDLFTMRLAVFEKCLIIFFRMCLLVFALEITNMLFAGSNILTCSFSGLAARSSRFWALKQTLHRDLYPSPTGKPSNRAG